MPNSSLKKRVADLEKQMASMLNEAPKTPQKKDWRRTVGMFTDNPEMQELFAEAQRIRDADREKVRKKRPAKRRISP